MILKLLTLALLVVPKITANGGTKSNSNQLSHKIDNSNMPSPEWLEYQRERYSHRHVALNGKTNGKDMNQATASVKDKTKEFVRSESKPNEKTQHESPRDMSDEAVVSDNDDGDEDTEPQVDSEQVNEKQDEEDNKDANEANNVYIFSGIQVPTLRGFVEFIQSIQKTWVRKARMNFEDKIELLKRLRDNLMRLIEDQYNSIFHPNERKRQKRGILGESNLEFPPEAALMTINFLTFATFLVKLVLQVIHIVKSKHYTLTGLGIDTMSFLKKS